MNRDKIAFGICLVLTVVSATSLLVYNNSVDQRFSELRSLNSDLADGSLDNYSQKEARQIIENGETLTRAPFQIMIKMTATAIFGLLTVLLYEKLKYGGRDDE